MGREVIVSCWCCLPSQGNNFRYNRIMSLDRVACSTHTKVNGSVCAKRQSSTFSMGGSLLHRRLATRERAISVQDRTNANVMCTIGFHRQDSHPSVWRVTTQMTLLMTLLLEASRLQRSRPAEKFRNTCWLICLPDRGVDRTQSLGERNEPSAYAPRDGGGVLLPTVSVDYYFM